MSSIANMFNSFEQAMRHQLETQESEMREELKERESEMWKVQAKNITNNRIVEELRPLCEEVPTDALDPVTLEPFEYPGLYRCGHALDASTIVKIAQSRNLSQQDNLQCPVCKKESVLKNIVTPLPLKGCVESFKKINEVFKKYK